MNWSKIKTIMISFLIAMNLFMIAFIAMSELRESKVPDEVVSACADILKKDGFSLDKSIIPTTTYNLPILRVSFYSASDLSEMFFGRQLAFRTSGNSLVANEGSLKLTVYENNFIYGTGNSGDDSYSGREIKRALKKLGFDMSDAVYDEKENCFYYMYSGVNLFNMYIKAEIDAFGNLSYVSAQWPGSLAADEEKTLSFATQVTKLKETFPDGGNITLIEPGYSLVSRGGGSSVFLPSWRAMAGNELKIIQ